MYCPTCGSEVTTGLNYCKRCGQNVTAMLDPPREPRPPRIAGSMWAVALTAIACFGILFGSIIALAALGIRDQSVFVPVAVPGSLSIFGIVALMLRFISRFANVAGSSYPPQSRPRREVKQPPHSQLGPPADYIPSVTEHTTRIIQERNEE